MTRECTAAVRCARGVAAGRRTRASVIHSASSSKISEALSHLAWACGGRRVHVDALRTCVAHKRGSGAARRQRSKARHALVRAKLQGD